MLTAYLAKNAKDAKGNRNRFILGDLGALARKERMF